MSATTSVKPDEQQRKAQLAQAEENIRQQKLAEQQQRLQDQNWWFYSIMDLEKVKAAKTKDKKLDLVRANVKTEEKKEAVQQQHDVAEAKYEPLYKDRRSRSESTVVELKSYLPAAEPLLAKFTLAHKTADGLLAKDKTAWKEAFDALHEVSISKAEDEAERLWAAGEKNARSTAPEFFKQLDVIKQALAGARSLMTVQSYEAFSARIEATGGALYRVPAPSGKEVMAATDSMKLLKVDLQNAGRDALNDKGKAAMLRLEVENLIKVAKGIVGPYGGFPPSDLATFQRQIVSADTNIGLRDYAAGVQLLEDLRTQVEAKSDAIEVAAKQARANWQQQHTALDDLMDRAEALSTDDGLPESVKAAAQETIDRIAALVGVTPGTKPTFKEALDEVAEIKADLDLLEKTAANVPGFIQARDAADQRVRALMDQAARAISAMPAALIKANGGKPLDTSMAVSPFNDTLSELLTRWESLLGAAVNAEELMEQAVAADLAKLLVDVDHAVTIGVDDAVQDITLAPARAEYAKARATAASTAASVMKINAASGVTLLEAIDSADAAVNSAATPEDILSLITTLKQLTRANAVRSSNGEQAILELQRVLREKLKEVPPLIVTMQNAVNTKKDASVQKPFATMLETTKMEYETLLALAGSQQQTLLTQSITDVELLITEIKNATKVVGGKGDKKDLSFAAAQKIIDGYNKRLAKDDVKTYALATATELGEKATAFTKDFGKTLLSTLYAELTKLGEAIDKMEAKAEIGKQQAAKFEELIKQQKKRLDGAPFKTDAPDYATATKGRLDQILTDAKFEDGLEPAKAQFVRLLQELDDAANSPQNLLGQRVDLASKQDDAVEAKRKAEIDESKWKGELEVVEKQLAAAKGGEIDSGELAGLRTTFTDCKKSVAKSKQYADGREQLKAVLKRLSLLEANPYGLVISARNKLPQVTGRVKSEIVRLSKALSEVSTAVEKVPDTDLPAADKKAVVAQLAAVRGLFNPAAFDKSVPIVASAQIDRNKRASARETALRDIRRMTAYLDDDYRLQTLAATPYKGDMRSVLSGLKLGLLDLENNLLVSMAK